MFQLNYQSHKSVYEQIVDNIKEQIMTGVLKENTQLPTVRELSIVSLVSPMKAVAGVPLRSTI